MNKFKTWLLKHIKEPPTGLTSQSVRFVLYVLSTVYLLVVRSRNRAYDKQWLKTHSVDANVISVGNLTTGGTGKTPFVIWLANHLKDSVPLAVVSRGYGAVGSELNDEGMELAWQVPGIIQKQSRDRVQAAEEAISELQPFQSKPTIILDDGFQHRRLSRDLEILVVDATNPWGYGHLLPRGLLREEVTEVRRANVVLLTRSDQIAVEQKNSIRNLIQKNNPKVTWAESVLKCQSWLNSKKQMFEIDHLQTKKALAFCGIGNPDAFQQTLQSCRVALCEFRAFEDHHSYSSHDVSKINSQAQQLDCDAIVCTMKDLVKVSKFGSSDIPIFALVTDIEITKGKELILDHVNRLLPKLKNAG